MKLRLPQSSHNWFTIIGAVISIISLFMIAFLFTLSIFWEKTNAYLGLVIYILLPAFMIFGLLLIPLGILLQKRKKKKISSSKNSRWPILDLNSNKHRNAFLIFCIGSTILLFISALGSYGAFQYTESVTFCGELCHEVMKPEFVAHKHSTHAKIKCVECHVGTGADWYIKSKINGLHQLYALMNNSYARPIPTPVKNMRPAKEICEHCHWNDKYYDYLWKNESYFRSDEDNTHWKISLLMKMGSPTEANGMKEGIHWHNNPNIKIEYISQQNKREKIPWIKYTNLKTGEEIVYQSKDTLSQDEKTNPSFKRNMDCTDCHNRPAHNYYSPSYLVNKALTNGDMSSDLPEIKLIAMEIFANVYKTTDEAIKAINEEISVFYEEEYPDIFEEKNTEIKQAVQSLKTMYIKNIFPEMKVRWKAYPNYIGHMDYKGCFRCHDDKHISADNKKIRKDCNLCHSIYQQGNKENMEYAVAGESLKFKHAIRVKDYNESLYCSKCHQGLDP